MSKDFQKKKGKAQELGVSQQGGFFAAHGSAAAHGNIGYSMIWQR